MKFLVTGVNGQLGHDVMNELYKRGYEGVGSDKTEAYDGISDELAITKMNYISLDKTDRCSVEWVTNSVQPDVIIHCAAWTAVDMAEEKDKRELVHAINADGTQKGKRPGNLIARTIIH